MHVASYILRATPLARRAVPKLEVSVFVKSYIFCLFECARGKIKKTSKDTVVIAKTLLLGIR